MRNVNQCLEAGAEGGGVGAGAILNFQKFLHIIYTVHWYVLEYEVEFGSGEKSKVRIEIKEKGSHTCVVEKKRGKNNKEMYG